tara:strand:+ start:673 stop:2001 length:1329 start_codon:yes stop_codon:yes gene_type:complete
MNKIFKFIVIFFFLNSCSFDNKTGIWTGSNPIAKNKDSIDQNLELIFKKKNSTIKTKELSNNQNLKLYSPRSFTSWSQRYQNNFNDISNVSFLNKGNYKKLSKISRTKVNKNILVYKDNLFFSDHKGNIGVFSLSQNQQILEYNFYKKKMKNTKKDIKLIIKDDFIIAADNFGYVYSINYKENKVKWAKNFLVPFRSNLKIIGKILFLSDEKNKIILIDTENGNKIDELYTQPSKTVSNFESSLAIDNNNNLLFLSTSGSLYSLNLINKKVINWIQNFKPEDEIIFKGSPIIISKDKILISTNNNISLLNNNGLKLWDLNIKSSISPIVSGNTIFTINEDNYLVLINKENGQVIYSKNIYLILEKDFKKNFQRKIKKIEYIHLFNNKLLLISNNSYFIEINIKNFISINSIKNNPFDISSDIIFVKNEMIFVSNSNRIFKVN